MSDQEKIQGLTCKCGKYEKYPAYVYAHWYETLIFTCVDCGRQYRIREGRARCTKEPRKGKKA